MLTQACIYTHIQRHTYALTAFYTSGRDQQIPRILRVIGKAPFLLLN